MKLIICAITIAAVVSAASPEKEFIESVEKLFKKFHEQIPCGIGKYGPWDPLELSKKDIYFDKNDIQ